MTIRRRNMLAHAYGPEYDLEEPYVCEGCGKRISEHDQYPPQNENQEMTHMHKHFSQRHGRPPAQQVALADVVCCSMHGEHNLLAQTFYATITQHMWNKKVTDEVAKVVNEEWNMKRFKIKQQTGTKAITKDTPHFNGPEGKKVIKERGVLLDIINKYVAKNSPTAREAAESLWLAQDELFNIWQTVEPDKSKWQALSEKARKAAEHYCNIFINICSASDGTVTMHYAMHHWPEDIAEHGSLAAINAQGLEASNQAAKNDGKTHCNRQVSRALKNGGKTRGRMAQILARSIIRQYNFVNHDNDRRLWRHVKVTEQKITRKGHKKIGIRNDDLQH
jgi:hypothetical protein